MDHQAGGFVDDSEMLVLENEREWDRGRPDGARSFVLGYMNAHYIAAPQHPRGPGDFSIHGHQLVGY